MLKCLAFGVDLFPDIIVWKEAAQLSFCNWTTVIRITVTREHVDAHSINFTDIHCSEKQIMTKRSRDSVDKIDYQVLNTCIVNLLSIYSCNHLTSNFLLIQCPQHTFSAVSPPLQVYHEHLHVGQQCNQLVYLQISNRRGRRSAQKWIEGHLCRFHLHIISYSPHQSPFCQVVF